jgi:hypothetical protein
MPLLPLAFLFIAEGLTRLINSSATYEGITIEKTTHKITQFADDTQLFVKNFESIRHICPPLKIYEEAIGDKANITKLVGIRCGSLKGNPSPTKGDGNTTNIRWLQNGDFTNILGAPHRSEV